jgi:serine/threonine protein kinase/tetratricopeptide (TPR) repeat protein
MAEPAHSTRCGKCGGPLSGYAPDGLCAACLLECAFEVESPLTTSLSPAGREVGVSPGEGKTPALPPLPDKHPRPDEESPGSLIGRYKLLEKIGEGGFGVVYVAEQREPVKRRVALKVIKLGMDNRQVVARFEAERQALAMMDHSNIAKVLDAGATETGRPYFVMELVRGLKITDYCDQHNLPARDRLNLFIQVCQAIQHAHQKGIIHRDIKPSNVLVTVNDSVPVPKVIDFGIAKATQGELTDKTVYTQFQQFIGTPAYMSPEQAEMTSLDIDTRSDIYALGVLLYELLTGKTPFEQRDLIKAGLDGMRRMIREQEPLRPSTRVSSLHEAERTTTAKRRGLDPPKLVSLLRGDLDWIVMKCLEKDRTRRYETANGVAMDIRRFLNDEPVIAARPSALYTFRKFARRHRIALATTTAFAVLLVAGVFVSTSQAIRASRAEKSAKREASKSLVAYAVMSRMLDGVGPSVARGRDTTMLREILDDTARRVGTDLKDHPEVEADLRLIIGKTYADMGLITNALEMTQEALRLRRLHLGPTNIDVAVALNNLGSTLYDANDYVGAEQAAREALVIRTNLLGLWHTNVATSFNNLAQAIWNQGRLAEAAVAHRRALEIRKKILPADHPDIGMSLVNLANLEWTRANFSSVEAHFAEALELFRRAGRDKAVAVLQANLATVLFRRGELAAAKELHEQTLMLRRKLFQADHPDLEISLTQLGLVLAAQDDLVAAEARLSEARTMQDRLSLGKHVDVADALAGLGIVRTKQGDWAEAEEKLQEALAIRIDRLKGETNPDVVDTLDALGISGIARGDLEGAQKTLARAVDAATRSECPDCPGIIPALWHLSWVLTQRNDPTNAGARRSEALAISRKHGVFGGWPLLKGIYELTDILRLQGKLADTEPLLKEAADYVAQNLGNNPTLQRDIFQRLTLFYEAWDRASPNTGKAMQATEWRKKLDAFKPTQ